jgi:hypothetical protein
MKAGRELDALIAEKVMGCNVYCVDPNYNYKDPAKMWRCDCPGANSIGDRPHADDGFDGEIKPYSTDIAAAWKVVEKMRESHQWIRIECFDGKWEAGPVEVCGEDYIDNNVESLVSAPHAICLAALKAIGHEFKNQELKDHMK